MLFGPFRDFWPKGYPYGKVQNSYFSKSQPDFNKFGFLAEGKNVENIYPSSPQSVFMAQKSTIPGLREPGCVIKTGGVNKIWRLSGFCASEVRGGVSQYLGFSHATAGNAVPRSAAARAAHASRDPTVDSEGKRGYLSYRYGVSTVQSVNCEGGVKKEGGKVDPPSFFTSHPFYPQSQIHK